MTQQPRSTGPAALALLGIAVSATLVTAAAPAFWRVSTQTEFLAGEVDALSIDADGHLVLGPVTNELFDTTDPMAWTVVPADGDRFWVGTGTDARLYLVEADGAGRLVHDAPELDIHALAPAGDAAVYLATSPDGRVDRVTPDGALAPLFDPDDTYIWALAVAPDGTVYAGTGNPARIYRVPPGGDPEVFFESDATHVLALALAPDGMLVAGTESPGQVVRIDPAGRGFVLLDAPYDEIRSVRVAPDGSILAVAVGGGGASSTTAGGASTTSTGNGATATVSVTTSVSAAPTGSGTASDTPASSSGDRARGTRGAVYAIDADGLWDILWRSDADVPYDALLRPAPAGDPPRLLVGTGPDGKIYEVSGDPPRTVLLGRAPAQQVTRLLALPDGEIRYTTANPGKLVRLGDARAARGSYESDVRDAGTVARWGTIRWRGETPGGSRIELSTRSGNTAVPNPTWSDWSPPYADPAGSQIESPNGRYLQWRAALVAGDATPVLSSGTAAYLPRNLRPAVTDVTVHPPGTVFQQPFSGDPPIAGLALDRTAAELPANGASLGRQGYRKGIQTLVWNARDDNDDELEFAVSYRRAEASEWRTLATGLRETVFAWDTSTVPDGAYSVRITASDAPGNAAEVALTGQRDSPLFDIDNTAPRITVTAVDTANGRITLRFTVEDAQSPVRDVELSQGEDRWRTVYPVDGIPDGLQERFVLELEETGGPLIIRATDALRNTSTASAR